VNHSVSRFSRRKFLGVVGAVGAANSAALIVASEASGQTGPELTPNNAAGSSGIVVGTAVNGAKRIQFDGEDPTPVELDLDVPHRDLRDGDRVAVVHQPATGQSIVTPLFLSVSGKLELVSDDTIAVAGVSAMVDRATMIYLVESQRIETDESSSEREAERIRTVPFAQYRDLSTGDHVDVLLIQNERDASRTVHALYPHIG
jgi:hypothetical protein